MVRLLIKVAETVYKARLHKFAYPLPFVRQKARNARVALRVVNVYGLMANVIIAANDEVRDLFFKVVDVLRKLCHVLKLVLVP